MKINLAALILGLSAIVCAWLAGSAFRYRSKAQETIVVTGLAEKDFESNYIVWNASFERKSMNLKEAYSALKQDEQAIRKYLADSGIPDSSMVFSAVTISREFSNKEDAGGRQVSQVFTGYNLTQTVSIESSNIEKIDKISREATALIEKGIEFNSTPPSYYNTKLTEVKMELLAKASADARLRAETIAKNAGSALGNLRKATMGVFQIVGKNTNESFGYGGAFNTSSRLKTGSITIKMEFATE